MGGADKALSNDNFSGSHENIAGEPIFQGVPAPLTNTTLLKLSLDNA